MVEVKEAEAGLGKTAVVKGRPFILVGVPAFDEENTVARVVLQTRKCVDKSVCL